jgi:hypothetical protein
MSNLISTCFVNFSFLCLNSNLSSKFKMVCLMQRIVVKVLQLRDGILYRMC